MEQYVITISRQFGSMGRSYIPGWQSVFDHKDLMIDSSRFGIDGTAKILADIVKNQWG